MIHICNLININDKIAKAYGVLGLIKRSFTNMSKDCFL